MVKHSKFVWLPLVVALPLVMSSADAVPIGTGAAAGAPVTTSQAPSRKQLKQERRLAKQCAKLSAGKIRNASKRATYATLCAKPAGEVPTAAGGGLGPDLVVEPDDAKTPVDSGPDLDSDGDGLDTEGGSDAGGGSSAGDPGQANRDESPHPPSVFTPPILTPPPGGGELPVRDPYIPVIDAVTPPTSVPEPGPLALLGLGLVGLALGQARRHR